MLITQIILILLLAFTARLLWIATDQLDEIKRLAEKLVYK
jgi:hypothetical protein